jgi:hypothetical protein
MAPVLKGKSIGSDPKNSAPDLENQESGQARYQGAVQLKDSICFKSVRIGS